MIFMGNPFKDCRVKSQVLVLSVNCSLPQAIEEMVEERFCFHPDLDEDGHGF